MRRALLAALALLAGAAGLVALAGDGAPGRHDPHAGVRDLPADAPGTLLAAGEVEADTDPAELVAQGRALFRDHRLAKRGESCQDCHTEGGGANAALGTIPHPQEADDVVGPRDPAALWGVARTSPYDWGGRTKTLEAFVLGTVRSHFAEGASQPSERTAEQVAALSAYLRSLEPPVSPFDQGTLSPAARRGEALFQGKAGCMACHAGPLLTDNALHRTGVPAAGPEDNDWGAASRGPLRGAFNTPQLRDVADTAPYMHNGTLDTLREVVDFYDAESSVAPLGLTEAEKADLVAYLRAL